MNDEHVRQPGSNLAFVNAVAKAFAFLSQFNLKVVEQSPTLVRYCRDGLEVGIYQGRKSFEIAVEVTIDGERFPLSVLVRLADAEAADSYSNPTARDDEGVYAAVTNVATLLRRFGVRALQGDPQLRPDLLAQRALLLKGLALDSIAVQTRPKAEAAFKAGDYARAADLYSQILPLLSPAEKGKLKLAVARSTNRH